MRCRSKDESDGDKEQDLVRLTRALEPLLFYLLLALEELLQNLCYLLLQKGFRPFHFLLLPSGTHQPMENLGEQECLLVALLLKGRRKGDGNVWISSYFTRLRKEKDMLPGEDTTLQGNYDFSGDEMSRQRRIGGKVWATKTCKQEPLVG